MLMIFYLVRKLNWNYEIRMQMGIIVKCISLGDFNFGTSALCVRRYSTGGIPDEDR